MRVASVVFGIIHRGIRALDQRFGILPVIGENADADACIHVQVVMRDGMRRRKRCVDLFGMSRRIPRVFDLGEHDHEFVSALAAHCVRTPHCSRQPLAHLLQQFVADRMTQRVVDVFEPIQVEKKQCALAAVAPRQRDRLVEAVVQ